METIKVYVGTIVAGSSGQVNDSRRPVQFEGEELANLTTYGQGRKGGITDTRGVTETLYKTADGRFVVHVEDWSHWQGEPTTEQLHQIEEAELQVGGRFEEIGRVAGYARPLTLDEALASRPEEEE